MSLLRPYVGPPPVEPVTEDPLEIEDVKEILESEQIIPHHSKPLQNGRISDYFPIKVKPCRMGELDL